MTNPYRLHIPRHLYDAMIAHALAELPYECCGLLAGHLDTMKATATHIFPLINQLASPTEYLSEPRSMFIAHKAMRAAGVEILAIYHSHPTSDPLPSSTDRARNYSESILNLIISLKSDQAEVRAWWLTSTQSREGEWEIND
jgi:proteasome lid subunit RPN8/RPN11